jgi:di/tricarboxylate transporter
VTEAIALTQEMMVVLGILAFTIYLFVSEIVRVDVAAIIVMVLLGLVSYAWIPLVPVEHLFDGFASNAVISIIAVMIIGAGLDRTGIMSRVAGVITRIGGTTESRIIPLISGAVGVISSFMQNVGAAALFLPVVSRISTRTGLGMSRLLMPMGFCAILGGTMTMVGSSPLILLNDLLVTSNRALPSDQQMEPFSLFSVTPIGVALVLTGILYFVLAGRYILPTTKQEGSSAASTLDYLQDTYGLGYTLNEMEVPPDSPLVGRTLNDFEKSQKVRVVAVRTGDEVRIGPGGIAREVGVAPGDVLAIMASQSAVQRFGETNRLRLHQEADAFSEALQPNRAGIAELVVPPSSHLVGKSAREVWLRKRYGLSLLALHRGGQTMREGEGVRDLPFQSGDTLICHTNWDNLAQLEEDRNFVVVTTNFPHEQLRSQKVGWALVFFALALSMVLFTDLRLSVALLSGALGMILSGVLTIDEAYEAVSWKTVFLLASLIPLGAAVENTGTAAWIAQQTLAFVGDVPTWVLQAVIAVLATFFTLVMSNVGATVLLVPLAVNIALGAGASPAVFALTVAIATSNSFLIPTHQVNALIMGPAGYRVKDFLRAGGVMTLLFLVVSLSMLNVVF